jgi:threonine/homoserine/homoserine lactone efflux protein
MHQLFLIVSGIVIGLIVAVPIGPVNLICIRRTLAYGPLNGFVSGLGAALGDGVFAVVTAFGLTAIAQLIEGFYIPLQLVGGVLLIFFGIRTFWAHPKPVPVIDPLTAKAKGKSTLFGAMASSFALTITNPATMLGFTALFAGLGGFAGNDASFIDAAVVVGGVFAGSALWWLTLTAFVGLFHTKIDERVMRWINWISGFLVGAFGVGVLFHLASTLL